MDTFEEKMKELVPVNRMERWRLYDYEKGGCLCKTCPSFTICSQGNGEALFCLMGMSFRCIREAKGCLCPGCVVHGEYGMTSSEFCMKGSEKEQRWEKALGKQKTAEPAPPAAAPPVENPAGPVPPKENPAAPSPKWSLVRD